ncbi:MAG: Peptidyl-tRNA hydrolase ArfB [Cytophagales bacterium]|jgi:ribosome-associated protein|nr:aminoacyl-tRNA hydrolase [Bacteroidota bacterium]MBS1982367.1 aminoacyl-tRNA hydrolase [Bacteroidota bacterium]WHZ06701.1 MAG: Peptidyl-tRNA hydrolase ArfB [Cytophagales bacterium]
MKPVTAENIKKELRFTASRASGPGGQNVNKVNTKITLRWDIQQSASLSVDQKELLLQKLSRWLTSEGELILSAQESRSQGANKEEVIQKLERLLQQAFFKKKKRKPTKPSLASTKRRVDKKKKHSEKKQWRRKLLG